MGWVRTSIAAAVLASSGLAQAAEITRVASSGDPDNPFDLDVSIRWDRTQRRGKITKEFANPGLNGKYGAIEDGTEMRFTNISNILTPRIAVGLYHDLELHVEAPWVIGDDHQWRYALMDGKSVGPVSSIGNNGVDASGQPCGAACPVFPVDPGQTVYHGGRLGDVTAGIAWAPLAEHRDDTKPTWLVGVDVTAPTADRYDPTEGLSKYRDPGNPGPVGYKVWGYDVRTAMSRRVGPVDPYVLFHFKYQQLSSTTYSNCEHADRMSNIAVANCKDPAWKDDAKARPPMIGGFTFGTEFVPYEEKADNQKVGIDLRLWLDYVSEARWYNELTDATGKLLYNEQYMTMGGQLGVYVRASKYVQLRANATLAHDFTHFLTNESFGKDLRVGGPDVTPGTTEQNPNFDWRYDVPGRRFRITEVSIFTLGVMGVVNF